MNDYEKPVRVRDDDNYYDESGIRVRSVEHWRQGELTYDIEHLWNPDGTEITPQSEEVTDADRDAALRRFGVEVGE